MSNAPTAAPTPTPAFPLVDNPLLGTLVGVGDTVVAPLLLAEVELADTELENVDTELAEEPEADEAEAPPESVAINAV
jgi:hypothetical protein